MKKNKKTLNFKKIKVWDDYDKGFCLAKRCNNFSCITIATKKGVPVEYGLCEKHWDLYCLKEEDHE